MPKKPRRQQAEETQLIAWYKWEFLRRNPEYRKDYDEFIQKFGDWFRDHGYWYDQTTMPWDKETFRFFVKEIAPKARIICEKWEIRDPFSPDWRFTQSGVYCYQADYEVLLPTDCPKEKAAQVWDLSHLLASRDELFAVRPGPDLPPPGSRFGTGVRFEAPFAISAERGKGKDYPS